MIDEERGGPIVLDAGRQALMSSAAGTTQAELGRPSLLAVGNARRLVADLRSIRQAWNSRITARRDSAVHRVADVLIKRAVLNARLLQRELGITTGNARRYVDPLTDVGIIVDFADRSRNRAWRAPEVLSALDEFAVRDAAWQN